MGGALTDVWFSLLGLSYSPGIHIQRFEKTFFSCTWTLILGRRYTRQQWSCYSCFIISESDWPTELNLFRMSDNSKIMVLCRFFNEIFP